MSISDVGHDVVKPAPRVERQAGARTLVRGLSILEIVAENAEGIGVTEIAERSGLDKGTVSRLLATLRQMGYVHQRDADRRYTLGSRLLSIARGYDARGESLRRVAQPHLANLRDSTQETVHLAVRTDYEVSFVAQELPDRAVRVRSAVGTSLPMHRTAMGRAILGALPVEERESMLEQVRRDAATRSEVVDLDALRAEASLAAERGWAAVDRQDEVIRLAAAILDPVGEPIAAITLSGPSYRAGGRVDELGAAVRETARKVSEELR